MNSERGQYSKKKIIKKMKRCWNINETKTNEQLRTKARMPQTLLCDIAILGAFSAGPVSAMDLGGIFLNSYEFQDIWTDCCENT